MTRVVVCLVDDGRTGPDAVPAVTVYALPDEWDTDDVDRFVGQRSDEWDTAVLTRVIEATL